jgi:hypothetical protein
MLAHQINLNLFKDQITSLFNDNLSAREIAERISSNHNITCTTRTIERRCKVWGFQKRSRIEETAALRLKL